MENTKPLSEMTGLRQKIGLILGPVLAIGLQVVSFPESVVEVTGSVEAAGNAWVVLSLLSLMAVWWITEAIPVPVTSLLPLILLPFFGVQTIKVAAAAYMHPIVVLLMGGFIIAKAIERWNLHSRIALSVVSKVGAKPSMLVAGFMFAAALLSMWISNTATAIMMMPIALSVAVAVVGKDKIDSPFTWALLLGVAYACSIGGLGTYIGTPTNLIVKGQLDAALGIDIGFGQWMMFGIPAVILLLPAAWYVLTKWAFPIKIEEASAGHEVVQKQLDALGKISTPEWRTIIVFSVVAGLWILRRPLTGLEIGGYTPFSGLTDHVTAIIGVVLCFLIPAGSKKEPGSMLLEWKNAESIPWGVLLLFGGGLSLAGAITNTNLGGWVGSELAIFAILPPIVLVLVVATIVMFATEITSNLATASALMPVLVAMSGQTGIDVVLLGAPLALAASCAFMLPMATGPNAVVYASGDVSLPTMAKAGFRLNLLSIPIVTAVAYYIAPLVLR